MALGGGSHLAPNPHAFVHWSKVLITILLLWQSIDIDILSLPFLKEWKSISDYSCFHCTPQKGHIAPFLFQGKCAPIPCSSLCRFNLSVCC